MNCDCYTVMDARLKAHNLRLKLGCVLMPNDNSLHARPIVPTEKIDGSSRKQLPTVFGNYCPFCGKPWRDRDGAPESRDDKAHSSKLSEKKWLITPESVEAVLLLVSDTNAPLELIRTWSSDQQQSAYAWAIALHYMASDNTVDVPPRPDFIPRRPR